MKIGRLIVAASVLAALLCGCSTQPVPTAADFRLALPLASGEREYLGLPDGSTGFRLEDISCEILVIDCFDMYCHICQSGAKHVNELYRLAQERGLGKRVKFVGLGVGDTPFEVALYKDKFKVPFPLFPDRRSIQVRQFGELKLPNLIVLRRQAGQLQVIHRSPGPLLDPAAVLSNIAAALNQVEPHAWNESDRQAKQPTCTSGSACRPPQLVQNTNFNLGPDSTKLR